MTDYPYSTEQKPSNAPEYTITALSMALKNMVEDKFGYVRLRGEISGLKRAASGHVYLALKDEKSVLDAIMWKGVAGSLTFRPEDGLEVICTGKLTTYPGRSKYQIVIDRMEPAGVGALMALLEERKKKLMAEGLFDPSRKKNIPYLPEVIGVVTSPTGAVIRDILHRLQDRFPRRVIVWPVLVQGEGAAGQIAEAIRGFNNLMPNMDDIPRPDVLIVARGGGSLEDLWAFNEEIVIRAVAESTIPVISAVGHETDTTLIDYVSDLRAPTPTAAAEHAVPVRDDLLYTVLDLNLRLKKSIRRLLDSKVEILKGLSRGLPKPSDMLALSRQRLDDISERLPRSLSVFLERRQMKFDNISRLLRPDMLLRDIQQSQTRVVQFSERAIRAETHILNQKTHHYNAAERLFESLNYKRVLDRGFAVIWNMEKRTVTSASHIKQGQILDIEFRDGHVKSLVTDENTSPKTLKKKTSPPKDKDSRQGNLL
ncbi:MAG: exodeoxyribonuclease VII large subunit [Emcibacter sp.]|nr:exodeoxyribonuclease VII large subunit [Emcibacter sp.]